MMIKVTKKQTKDLFNTIIDVFDRQSTALPVIYLYKDEIDISRGDTFGGMAMPVHDREAAILISTHELHEYFLDYRVLKEHNKKDMVDFLHDDIQDAIENLS